MKRAKARPVPRKPLKDRLVAELEAVLVVQQRDLASVANSEQEWAVPYAAQCVDAIALTESAIRKVQGDNIPEGWAEEWGRV